MSRYRGARRTNRRRAAPPGRACRAPRRDGSRPARSRAVSGRRAAYRHRGASVARRVEPCTMRSVGAATCGSASKARSGRPPRETMAPMGGSVAAATLRDRGRRRSSADRAAVRPRLPLVPSGGMRKSRRSRVRRSVRIIAAFHNHHERPVHPYHVGREPPPPPGARVTRGGTGQGAQQRGLLPNLRLGAEALGRIGEAERVVLRDGSRRAALG